jgi:hypothetical protein
MILLPQLFCKHSRFQYSAGFVFDDALLHAFADAFVEHIDFFQLFCDPFEAVMAMLCPGAPIFTSVRRIITTLFLLVQFFQSTPSPGFSKYQSLLHGFHQIPPSSLESVKLSRHRLFYSFKVCPRDAHFCARTKRRVISPHLLRR